MKATSVRIDESTMERIDGLAGTLNRSRSWVVKQAIARFLEYEEWFVQEVQEGLKEVDRGEVATPAQVKARFKKWGVDAR